MIPKTIEERKLWEQGYSNVACVDEVGRGPLAGPVVAAAVCLTPKLSLPKLHLISLSFSRLRDSKKLSPKRREEVYKTVKEHSEIQWGIGVVSEKLVDKMNIFQATKLAMKKAIANLQKKISVDFLVIDGNMKIDLPIHQKSIIKGDEKVFSCALASIVAKVTRDRMMVRYHKEYPQYGFNRHKGYGTKLHLQKLRRFGPCPIHRRTFAPLKNLYSVTTV